MSAALAEALSHHQAGRQTKAETLYSIILADQPAEPTALYLSGLLNYEMGRLARATERLEALVAVRPRHVASQLALANLHVLENAGEAAIAGFRRVIALDPDHAEARRGLSEALLAAGRPHEAVVYCLPGDGHSRLTLARALLAAGRPREALLATEDAASGDAWLTRGACLKALCRLPEAAAALRQAVALAPGRATSHLTLGNVCAELELFREAERHLRLAVACDDTAAEAQASLGSVLLLTGRIGAAERWFHRALALDPGLVAAHQNLAAILTNGARHAAARQHRDLAYRRQNVFTETSPDPVASVLLLTTAAGGNVPARFLFPRTRYTRITWVIEYAGASQHTALPPYDLVFNAIGDPDMAAGTETPLSRFLPQCDRPVLNDPARIARTCRHMLPTLLAGLDDVVVPAVRRLLPGTGLAESGLPLPIVLRPAGSHGGQDVRLVASAEALTKITIAGPEDCYVTAFHDYRSSDGYFRKYRIIFVDRVPYFYHLAIGRHWVVHYVTADMVSDPAKRREEQAFLADPAKILGPRALCAIQRIGQRLDLDFCGADLSLLPDGRVLVFEANATMLVSPEDPDGQFAYKNRAVNQVLKAFDDMLRQKLGHGAGVATSTSTQRF